MSVDTVPAGFRRSVETGLILPEPVSREREYWSRDEWRFHERAAKFYASKGIQVYMRCQRPACQSSPMTQQRQPDGSVVFRCEHADRVLQKHF